MDPEFNPLQPRPKKWRLSRKQTWLLVGGIAALVVIIVVVILATRGNNTQQSSDQATSYDRPGYDRKKLGSAFADPFAIKFTPNSKAVEHKDNKVIQACNLLSIEDVTKQGLLIKANTLATPVTRTFNDGVGKAEYNQQLYASSLSGQSVGGFGADINNCHYVLQSNSGAPAITINMFQPFAVPMNLVNEEIQDNYTASSSIEGLEVFTKKAAASPEGRDTTEYIVRKQDKGAFYLSLGLEASQAPKKQALLEAVSKNFNRELATPSGNSTLGYDSPIFTKSITHACDLLSNEHVRTLSGRDAGPLASEGIATSVGAIKFTSTGDQTMYLYIDNECTRSTTGGGSGLGSDGVGDLGLKVTATNFLANTPAQQAIAIQRQANPNNRENISVSEQIGDEAVGYADNSNGYHIVFSRGRIVVDVELSRASQRLAGVTSLQTAVQKLTPIAQEMAGRVKE